MFTELKAADGHVLECWMHPAQGLRKGGIVILQEIFGVTDQLKGVATRYAALGYEVAIPALFDRQERGMLVPFDQAIKGRDMMLASDLSQTMMDADAAVQALGGKVAVIGFCWGGGLAIHAAQVLDIVGAVSFYGTRLPQYMDQPLRAPVLGHFGTQDHHTPPELISEARTAWPQMEVHMYPAGHAFANDARPSYVADATATAHARTEAFLAQRLC
ncbi:dienelactone hydrolase family protein [Rhodobacteraceae bacterium N5(2021)]|uniref:Dienelactone hydrolase family protein n=1 Tax=Gymnodinialimonas phycosphaerae TaxID=2841589 RepID=A0A975TXT5_9RHOB|nr:dienelactone hydrolase family protein [Gymnodinialimonas phycosphaerae]MBY4891867.1 dienelactone hydrolase family protein [Gymnodinialimonas phycosphaerae]